LTNADRRRRICSEGLTPVPKPAAHELNWSPLCLKNRDLQGSHLLLGPKTAHRFACAISHAPPPNRCSLKNVSKSALIWSAFVVGMPFGKPLQVFNTATV